MAQVNYSRPPQGMMPRQGSPVDALMRGYQTGQQVRNVVQGRKRRKALQKILGRPGPLTSEQLREIAKIDPGTAKELAQLDAALASVETSRRDDAIKLFKMTNETSGMIALSALDAPPERRAGIVVGMIDQLAQDPATRPLAGEIMKDYDGGDLSDESLIQIATRAMSVDERLKAREAESMRKKKAEDTAATDARRQQDRLDLATHQSGLRREEARLKGDIQKEVIAYRASKNTATEHKKPLDQRVAGTMREAREFGIELSYHEALYLTDNRRLLKSTDPATGQEVFTDNQGNPIDTTKAEEFIRLRSGGEPAAAPPTLPEGENTLATGSAVDVTQRLQAPTPPAAPATPPGPTVPPVRRRPPEDRSLGEYGL